IVFGEEERGTRISYPARHPFGCLVRGPPCNNVRISMMVGHAQLMDGSAEHPAACLRVAFLGLANGNHASTLALTGPLRWANFGIVPLSHLAENRLSLPSAFYALTPGGSTVPSTGIRRGPLAEENPHALEGRQRPAHPYRPRHAYGQCDAALLA